MSTPRGTYAKKTDVPVERTIEEIEATLRRYGCQRFARMSDLSADLQTLAWEIEGIGYRVTIRAGHDAKADQVRRQRWRAALLAIKAALEWSEQSGEPVVGYLLPHMVLSDGRTMAESAAEHAAQITGSGWTALLEGKNHGH